MVDPKSGALVDEMLSHLRADFVDSDSSSRVAQFYANKSVFITGATGFIGKALVEKLVRSCADIKKIYLLVREKRGKDVKSRLTDLMQSQIFNRIKSQPGGSKLLEQKLHAIQGDITMEKFGINPEDQQLLCDQVSVVFNSAATIRFVEPIDVAVRNNIYSVAQLVSFCNQLPNLQALVHLSTAYSNCHKRDTIYEIFYEPPMSGEQIIQAVAFLRDLQNSVHVYPSVAAEQEIGRTTAESQPSRSACAAQIFYEPRQEFSVAAENNQSSSSSSSSSPQKDTTKGEQNLTADLLDQFTQIALRRSNRPNTYTFTKAIAESYLLDLVQRRPERYLGPRGIPVAIVRPSIVGGAWREPDVGFVDNYNGGTGAILSLYTGALQAMPGCGERVADMVPVDMVVNMILSTGYFLASSYLSEQQTDNHHQQRQQHKIKADRGVYIFNLVSGYRNPLRWHQVTQMIRHLAYKYPSKFQVRLCGSYFVSAVRPNLFGLYDYLNHYWPARVQDFLRRHLLGEQLTQRSSSLGAYGRIKQMTDTLTPFTSNQWLLCDSNVVALRDFLAQGRSSPSADSRLFQFDIGQIDWQDYIRNYILGARIYTLKDEPRNVPKAMRSLKNQLESALVGSFEALALSD